MDPDLPQVEAALTHWPEASGAAVRRMTTAKSFSGAAVWRVSLPGGDRALKRSLVGLPGAGKKRPFVHAPKFATEHANEAVAEAMSRWHKFQNHLAAIEPRLVAQIYAAQSGQTIVSSRGCYWQLETWLPGAADFAESPSEHRVIAAAKALAKLHLAAAGFPGTDTLDEIIAAGQSIPHDLSQRLSRSRKLLASELKGLVSRLNGVDKNAATALLADVLRMAAPHLPQLADELARACEADFDVKWILGDAREGNILFSGAEVTGFVDLGTARRSIQAGDLVRMLGSMVGDDRARWLVGLAAYESVRPLPLEELRVIDLLRRSEIVLSAANWVGWLMPGEPLAQSGEQRYLDRLAALADRLRRLTRWD
ncbi:MAG: hypothetical protein CMJ58_16740 [Planctomycetaceae bacterium]|nr:hypothetical protein [Planctomycetaceae bacterium]